MITHYSGRVHVVIDNVDGVDLKWLGDIIMQDIPVVENHRVTSVSYQQQTVWDRDRRESIPTGKWILDVDWEQVKEPDELENPPDKVDQLTD